MATGKGIARCHKRHRHQEWLAFLRLIDRGTPEGLDLHLVCDNYATHKQAKVRAWVGKRPRIHLHFIPTYASWLNQVERWFGLLSESSTFHRVTELAQRIMEFTEQYNGSSRPFVRVAGGRLKQSGMRWTKDGADAIVALRCCVLSGRYEDFWEWRSDADTAAAVPPRAPGAPCGGPLTYCSPPQSNSLSAKVETRDDTTPAVRQPLTQPESLSFWSPQQQNPRKNAEKSK